MNRKTIIIILIAIFITLLTFSSAAFFINNLNIKKENIEKKESQIKITIGWDIMLSRMVWYLNQKEWFDRITKKYNPITQSWWIVFLNLESPFSKFSKDTQKSTYYFWAHTWSIETINSLKWNNKMILSLANNHIKNSLKEWIVTTINLLDKHNIYYSWIWLQKVKAEKILKIKIKNNLICLQSFTYDWWNFKYVFVNNISKINIKKSLDLMNKEKCDLNLISLHWGREYKYEPTKEQTNLAHYIIDNWADMIIWHHSHIFGKTEIYKEKPIFYSLGNYIFDQDSLINNCNKYTSCIYDEKVKNKVLPVQIWISYELVFEKHKNISKIKKKHRMENYWELTKY
jgi:hypothetical protein